jgi:hypothetical protein
VADTADVLDRALAMSDVERHEHARALRELAGRRVPADWLADQLAQVP